MRKNSVVWIGSLTFPNSLLSKKQGNRPVNSKIYDTPGEDTWLELRRRNINSNAWRRSSACRHTLLIRIAEHQIWGT